MTRILCLWLPNWAIQRAVRGRPELRGRPMVLVAAGVRGKVAPRTSTAALKSTAGRASSGTQSIVAACCERAVAQGVRPGMPLAEAQALSRNLQTAAYEPSVDRGALVKLAEACERFSPRVAVEEGDEPESLLLDISNLEHLCGSEEKLVKRVENFFTGRGYRVRLAVGETVGAAWAAAHWEEWSLPIEALRVSDDTAALLRELGIKTIDQLLALPREELNSRFGEELLRRLDQLTGQGRELIEPQRGLPALEASYALEEPTGDRGVLVHVLKQLVDRLAWQLAARGEGVVVCVCLLRLVGNSVKSDWQPPAPPGAAGVYLGGSQWVSLRVGLLDPSASARQILELIELHLENVRLADEVDRVELQAVVTGRLGERQRELFADRWLTDPHQLAVLVNRLSSRLGSERVLQAELRKSAAPERAVGWRVAVERREGEKGRGGDKETRRQGDRKKSWKSNSPCLPLSLSPCLAPRPLMLYPAPEVTEVVCVSPDGPPEFVWVGRHRERVAGCVGPERIETLWWRGASVRRDYYRVATESGGQLWMFRRLGDGRWFVHGEFS